MAFWAKSLYAQKRQVSAMLTRRASSCVDWLVRSASRRFGYVLQKSRGRLRLPPYEAGASLDIHEIDLQGMAGFVLANGSMSSNQSGEGDIRRALIEADLVDCMIALPGQPNAN